MSRIAPCGSDRGSHRDALVSPPFRFGPPGRCYIDMLNPFAKGTTVQVRLTREKKSFEAEGTVVHSQPGMGMGVAFTAVSPDQLEVLRKWLGEVTGESSALETSPAEAAARRPPQQKELRILNKLISLMMSKRLLSESEGEELLRDLSR